MFSMRVHAATAVAALLLVGASTGTASAAPRHLRDGSFEYPRVPSHTFQEFLAGASIGPWLVTSGSVDLIGAGYWQAAEGEQSLDLDGFDAGSVSQTFNTIPGRQYTVTYALAGNLEAGPTVKTGRVLIDGQDFQDFSFDVTGKTHANMGYVNRQVTFVATNRTTTLGFASTTPGAAGPVIDHVRVESCRPCPCGSWWED